jgi:hypothetical protein
VNVGLFVSSQEPPPTESSTATPCGELDVELGTTWNHCNAALECNGPNAQYAVQKQYTNPQDPYTNKFTIGTNDAGADGTATHFITWSSSSVIFESIKGTYTIPPGDGVIQSCSFPTQNYSPCSSVLTDSGHNSCEVTSPTCVPPLDGNDRGWINIWLGSLKTSNGMKMPEGDGSTEVVVSNFTFCLSLSYPPSCSSSSLPAASPSLSPVQTRQITVASPQTEDVNNSENYRTSRYTDVSLREFQMKSTRDVEDLLSIRLCRFESLIFVSSLSFSYSLSRLLIGLRQS